LSQGNVDRYIYKNIPDYAVQLTDEGHEQAKEVGEEIKTIIGDKYAPIQFYVSPFWRTRQTYAEIRKSFTESIKCNYYEDPRLREQEWGAQVFYKDEFNFDAEKDRNAYGHFYYRFEGGESCADVYDRVSDFMGTFFRDCEKEDFPNNVIIVTHGMSMRLFLMRWFHTSVEEFESWKNPKNCGYYLLSKENNERYKLITPLKTHKLSHTFQFPFEDKTIFNFPHKLPYEK
jgi:broad specificity phosphatase PhoE